MKQVRFTHNRISSGRNSRFLAPQQLMHRVVAILVLAMTCSEVWAADYVFISNETNGYFIGSDAKATQTFTEATCVWSCINRNNNTANSLDYTNRRRLHIDSNYLNGLDSNSGTVSIGTTRNAYWYSDGTILYYYRNDYRQVYRDGTDVKWNGTSNPFRVYSSYTKTDEVFTVAAITGVNDVLTATGTFNLSSATSYTPEYYKFTGPDTRYYASGYTTGAVTTEISAKTSGFTKDAWTITPETSGITINSSGQLIYTTQVTNDTQITITHTVTENGKTKSAEKTITLFGTTVNAPVITPGPGQNQYTITGPVNSTIKYTINGQDIDASGSNGTTYSGPVTVTTPNTTIKAKAVRDGHVSAQTEYTITAVTLAAPTITISDAGSVTITNPNGSVGTIHYTIDGSEPTASSDTYSASFTVNNMATVKAIVTGGAGYTASAVASKQYKIESGIDTDGGIVTLNDYEDHTWTYYTGVSSDVDGGNYNTNYAGILYSPDPRNVKITYKGGSVSGASAVAVSATESANQFVYYKTIEKVNNAYTYQVISNPFSKRPRTNNSTGTNGYWGFAGWKIINGGKYIVGHNNNEVLVLDETITLTNFDDGYTPNCTSAVIELEATWTAATVRTSAPGTSDFTSGTYETNFWVLTANVGATTFNKNMTVSARYPDGTSSGDFGFNNTLTVSDTFTGTVKLEYLNLTGGNNINAGGRNLYIGRGISGTSTRTIYGTNTSGSGMNQVLKVESGTYSRYNGYGVNPGGHTKQTIVFGNDYDRANNDNSKLNITGKIMGVNDQTAIGQTSITHELMHFIVKSGKLISSHPSPTVANYDNSIYMLDYGHNNNGIRILEMEGGEVFNIIGGANACGDGKTDINIKIRIKGGTIPGCVYGGGARYDSNGSKQFVFTGGTINGWIAGGCNGFEAAESGSGTSSQYGSIDGQSYIYVGGNTVVGGNESSIDKSIGGYVFGAGAGKSTTSQVGRAKSGTNVVLADNASVKHGIYGGGAYGYCDEGKKATIYITGGTVEAEYDDVYDVPGGVYGGARQNKGGYANIYMTGGLVKGGIYGGSNASGTMANDVMIQINGGQVGTSAKTANIHGGGYGQPTVISGNVDITLGATGADRDADGVVVYGDVYGGSALGRVNGTAATTTYHTNVTMNAGYIHGSLYGGALGAQGTAANVYGPVQVKVYGGSVMDTDGTGANGSGAVYGANNINGAPQRSVTVDIYGTNSAPAEGEYALFSVYGGGNQAAYTYGNGYPRVTVHNCDNSIEYVYGGGNAAAVAATDVTIYGGDKIGNVFGGGNGQVKAANVTGGTNVKIYGGTIGDVYGGSNTNGTIGGTISVNVDATAESGKSACPIDIDNVYGGGNKAASAAGNITIGCAEHIGAVYGGANQANVTGDINLKIESGHIDNVFGGNNNSGTISGKIVVTIEDKKSTCGMEVGNVYAGGNKAPYSTPSGKDHPVVNIKKGSVTGDVFGGGLGSTAVITGNPVVNINGGTVAGRAFGGGSAASVTGNTTVNVISGSVKDVFGGGLGAATNVSGNVVVNIQGGTVTEDVYGGSALGSVNTSASNTTQVNLTGGTVTRDVYGGGLGDADNAAIENGKITVTLGQASTTVDSGTGTSTTTGNSSAVGGSIFGANNVNGTPKDDVNVIVNWTTPVTGSASDAYHVAAVYGGGNKAAYIPANADNHSTHVTVNHCQNSIEYVYGGGNAAPVPSTVVLIKAGEIGNVFGGGNGAGTGNPGANVGVTTDGNTVYGTGNTLTTLCGGTIGGAFGGSNTLGNIKGTATLVIDEESEEGDPDCPLVLGEAYGGANKAYMDGTSVLDIRCISSMPAIYGGSKEADINSNIVLTINSGTYGQVFGGNNLGGKVKGSITVNIEETGCHPVIIGEVYGCGNQAAYDVNWQSTETKVDPVVNVVSCTKIGRVFGGGYGAKAVVTGNPTVNINMIPGDYAKQIDADGNGEADNNETQLGVIGEVFGGGNAADVVGQTNVNIGTVEEVVLQSVLLPDKSNLTAATRTVQGANINAVPQFQPITGGASYSGSGNVYGGGNQADVTGKSRVQIGPSK